MAIDHDLEALNEGQDYVMTLKDTNVLDENEMDFLENTEILSDHKLKIRAQQKD